MNSPNSSTNPPEPNRSSLLPPERPSYRLPELPPEEPIHSVDQVAIRKLGGFNFLEVDQWLELPKHERMRLIKSGVVTFLNDGKETPLRAALEYLKSLGAQPEPTRIAPQRPPLDTQGRGQLPPDRNAGLPPQQ